MNVVRGDARNVATSAASKSSRQAPGFRMQREGRSSACLHSDFLPA
jgi:hypothetical protein